MAPHVPTDETKIVHRIDLVGAGGCDDAVESGGSFRTVRVVVEQPVLAFMPSSA